MWMCMGESQVIANMTAAKQYAPFCYLHFKKIQGMHHGWWKLQILMTDTANIERPYMSENIRTKVTRFLQFAHCQAMIVCMRSQVANHRLHWARPLSHAFHFKICKVAALWLGFIFQTSFQGRLAEQAMIFVVTNMLTIDTNGSQANFICDPRALVCISSLCSAMGFETITPCSRMFRTRTTASNLQILLSSSL